MTDVVTAMLTGLRSFGDHTALECNGATVSYRQLADNIGELAHRLRAHPRISRAGAVLVTTTHTPATITAILSCIKAGVTYVLVPESISDTRLTHIRSSVDAVAHIHSVDGDLQIEQFEPRNSVAEHRGDPPLAILHTSGSTGLPKSVVIARRNLEHFIRWCRHSLPLGPADRVAVLSPLHFDLVTHDLFHGLGSGATLCIPTDVERTNAQAAARFVVEQNVTGVYMVPTFLERVATAVVRVAGSSTTVSTVMFAGERLTAQGRSAVEAAFPRARLHNLYGPIETNVITARSLERGRQHDSSDVGPALPGVRLAIRTPGGGVDGHGRGELVVSGDAVTPGYLDAQHNVDKFVADGGRIYYRTGDEATLSSAGVYLHGRLDSMVKLRGQRVELDEVEATISQLELVSHRR